MPASVPVVPALASSRSRAALLCAAVFVFFLSSYTLTLSGDIFSTGDTIIRIQLAENIAERASVQMHGWTIQYPHHIKKEFFDPRVSRGRGGATFSTYLLGQPLAIAPIDILAKIVARHERWPQGAAQLWFDRLVGPLFGALEVLVFFLFAVRLGYGRRRSLLLSAIFAFATMCWPDEQSVLEHTEVAFFLLLGVYFAFRFREQKAGQRFLLYSGAGLGGAMITRYQDAFIAFLAVALYLALPDRKSWNLWERVRREVLFGLGMAPFVAIDLWYSWFRFGSMFATGHHETLFGYPVWKGAPGLLVSPGKGLIWYCPTIFLLVFAGPIFVRRYRGLSVAFIALAVGFVTLYANVTFWHGDPAWGPRYIYPIVPFLTLPLGELFRLQHRHRRLLLAITTLVVAGGLVVQVSAVSVSQWRGWYKVISFEEAHGHKWQWIASRYDYFWNVHESPLNFQVRSLYQQAYDSFLNRSKYELVPPDEDGTLDSMTVNFAINQWNFWWTTNEFNWWMRQDKIILVVVVLLSTMIASGTYALGEVNDLFAVESRNQTGPKPVPEAA